MQNENYSLYAERLSQYTQFNTIICVVMSVVVIGLSIFCWRCLSRKWTFFSLATGTIIVASVYLITILPVKVDIRTQDYFSYCGEFYIEEHSYGNRRGEFIYIILPQTNTVSRYKVACNADNIENKTTYWGSFVVANNSKVLVDITLDKER